MNNPSETPTTNALPEEVREAIAEAVKVNAQILHFSSSNPNKLIDVRVAAICDALQPLWPKPAGGEKGEGIEAAAKLLDKKADDYAHEHGSYDHDTGATEFSRSGEDYYNTLRELADEIRTLKTK